MAYRSVGMAKRIKEDKVISKKTIGERKVLAQNDKKFSIYLTLLNKYKVYFILSIILILALVATIFGINSYKNNIKVISIDDDNYTKSDYMIYLYSAKYNYYGNKVNDIKSSDLDVMYDDESKITVRDYLNEVAVGDIKTASAIKTIARKNNIPNKVKIMEIIKDHNTEINKKINYYNSKKEDYKIIIISSGILLLMFGFMFIFSFFTGSYILLILTLLSFSICLYLYLEYVYKILLFREEIKRLVYIKEEHEINYDDNELKEIAIDSFKVVKNKFYSGLEKIIDILDKKQKI